MTGSGTNPAPSVWSLISSIGLVYFVPQLLLLVVGMLTGGLGIGTPELTLLMLIYVVGIPLVVWRWLARRRDSARPPHRSERPHGGM
jgi:positive regulator of sigma E activity